MLLKVAEAAERLAISPKQVRKLMASGKLPFVRLGDSAKLDRILPADIEKVVQECRYINGGKGGGSSSSTGANALGKVLDRALPKRTRRSSKRKSSPALKIVQKDSTT